MTNDLYFYLARRDKKGVRIIAKFQGTPQMATRISDISSLVPPNLSGSLNQIIYDSRMLWEPWVESAESYADLRNSLEIRGYTNIPISSTAEYKMKNMQKPLIDTSSLPQRTTMLRKKGT